ncbi:hypothetical protein DID75_00140 [Candidatus Marinamargulisbacteria bacterium SCGC AG-410-N11]|nr:hypothetical protein DID75_00140 [Candidatus Marinamargulisbacteria bacterium SCGC AG-410-N11]
MEQYNIKPVSDFYDIYTSSLDVGNYKYGNLFNSHKYELYDRIQNPLFSLKLIEGEKPNYKTSKKTLSFYNIVGEFGCNTINLTREWSKNKYGFIELSGLFSEKPTLYFNKAFRKWSILRISKIDPLGAIAEDITTIKLLDCDILSFHGGALCHNEDDGFIITGLPDVGKTYTTIELMNAYNNLSFLSEDIVLIDKKFNVYSVPCTQTIEKRKKRNFIEKVHEKLYGLMYQKNFIKKDIFSVNRNFKNRVANKTKIKKIFLLKRGEKQEIICLKDKKKITELIIKLNNLEFNYWKNDLILTYLFFNKLDPIEYYLKKEAQLITTLIKNVEIYEVYSDKVTEYPKLISKYI